jgi:hypothetical protein
MNSNSDAKLVDAMQSGIGLVLFFSGKEFLENSTKPNRQKLLHFQKPPESRPIPRERIKNHVGILSYPSLLTYATFRRTGKLYSKGYSLHPVTRGALFWMNPNEAFHNRSGAGQLPGWGMSAGEPFSQSALVHWPVLADDVELAVDGRPLVSTR